MEQRNGILAWLFTDYRNPPAGGSLAQAGFYFCFATDAEPGRTAGLVCALGVALGLGIHIAYSVLGMAVLIAQAAWLLTAIKIIGGAYLVWLGIQGLRAKAKKETTEIRKTKAAPQSLPKTLWKGFLCNVLNPKASVYSGLKSQ